jgi:methionyl-tRNA formyltransferase
MQWPALNKFSMLLINNNRSKAYLQNLTKCGYCPEFVIVLDYGNEALPEHSENEPYRLNGSEQKLIRHCPEAGLSFNEKEHILVTLRHNNISHKVLNTMDANSSEVIEMVKSCPGEYIVYSGPGGAILQKDILSAGKHMIHTHSGWLPDYRGSTSFYYSLLTGDEISCSVIVLTEEIDKGNVFYRRRFQTGTTMNVDYVLDPAVRAASLVDFFNINRGQSLNPIPIPNEKYQEMFFIIHPVLKHLALLSLDKKNNDNTIQH